MKRSGLILMLASTLVLAHDDVAGTRYVDPSGTDEEHCSHRDEPCRTLDYALQEAEFGDAIKLGAGVYDFSGLDLENLLFGKQGLRGGYSAETGFLVDDPVAHRTDVRGADPRFHPTLFAHGFTPVDDAGNPVARPLEAAQARTDCTNGRAGEYPCWNIDYLARMPLTAFTGAPVSAANLWGFVDRDDQREYALIGLRNGLAVVDVTDPLQPREVGFVQGVTNAWREVRTYQVHDAAAGRHRAYAYVVSEGAGSGLQIIDLTHLPTSVSLAATLTDFSTAHTIYVSNIENAGATALPGATPYLYVAGSNLLGGRYRIYDLSDPLQPSLVTVNPGIAGVSDLYMHDSTSVLVTDARTTQCAAAHSPCEVMIDFDVTSVDLWDVTDKSAPALLASATYPNARYIHSGWPTADGRHVIVHDELDELRIAGLRTSIYTLDISDLRTPTFVTSYTGPDTSTDHNGYTLGDRYYLAHYRRGLVIFDVGNPRELREVGYFDTYLLPQANAAGTDGAWGVYPYLPSGTILVSDIENGLFVLKRNETSTTPPAPAPAPTPTPTPTPPASSGGGGGGAIDLGILALLLAALLWQRGEHALSGPARPSCGGRRGARASLRHLRQARPRRVPSPH